MNFATQTKAKMAGTEKAHGADAGLFPPAAAFVCFPTVAPACFESGSCAPGSASASGSGSDLGSSAVVGVKETQRTTKRPKRNANRNFIILILGTG